MHPAIRCQLGVERRGQHGTLANQHWDPLEAGQHLDVLARRHDEGRADEDGLQRRPTDGELGLEGLLLAPVPVTADHDVDQSEGVLVGSTVEHLAGHQHQTGAGAQQR